MNADLGSIFRQVALNMQAVADAPYLEAVARAIDVIHGAFASGRIGLTGADSGAIGDLCDVTLAVPLNETARIQEVHLVTYHAICSALEGRLASSPASR